MTEHASMRNVYLAVFGALIALTGLTVGVAYLHLSRVNAIAVALAIVAIKVSLITSVFMHLKSEGALIRGLIISSLIFALLMLLMILPDFV